MKKTLDFVLKYWVILAAMFAITSFTATTMHSHASEHAQQQQSYNLKNDKELELIRLQRQIDSLRRDEEKAPLGKDRKDDLVYYIGEKAYIQKVLREFKK